jgi:hypothetical protein
MIKPSLTGLLLLSTMLSCAAVNPNAVTDETITQINQEPTIQTPTKPAPDSNFGQYEAEPLETPSNTPTEEGIPLTVVDPPPGMELEVIESEPTAVASYPYLTMRNSGQLNRYGNPIYVVAMYDKGRLIGTVKAVTGRAHTQQRNRNVAGTEAPLPNGQYRVATNWIGGTHPEVGGRFLPITPLFSTGRTALGFHVDPSYNEDKKEDGTAGCIGLTTVAERDLLFNFVQQHKPKYLQVAL